MQSENPIIHHLENGPLSTLKQIKNSYFLRDCFDCPSHEYKQSTIQEKIEAIKYITEKYETNTLDLVMGLMMYSKESGNTTIKPLDVVFALSELLDSKIKKD